MARILIIDDNAEFRFLLRLSLERAGHQVAEANNGAEGLRAIARQMPEVVCCDLFMPVKEGLETIRELRRDFPGVKVIAMSGGAGVGGAEELLQVAWHFGAAGVLQKPFEMEALLAVVDRTMKQSGEAGAPSPPPTPPLPQGERGGGEPGA